MLTLKFINSTNNNLYYKTIQEIHQSMEGRSFTAAANLLNTNNSKLKEFWQRVSFIYFGNEVRIFDYLEHKVNPTLQQQNGQFIRNLLRDIYASKVSAVNIPINSIPLKRLQEIINNPQSMNRFTSLFSIDADKLVKIVKLIETAQDGEQSTIDINSVSPSSERKKYSKFNYSQLADLDYFTRAKLWNQYAKPSQTSRALQPGPAMQQDTNKAIRRALLNDDVVDWPVIEIEENSTSTSAIREALMNNELVDWPVIEMENSTSTSAIDSSQETNDYFSKEEMAILDQAMTMITTEEDKAQNFEEATDPKEMPAYKKIKR